MDLLEYYHDNPPQIEHFIVRKTSIPSSGNVNLYGARGSGKTSLALDYVDQTLKTQNVSKPLYIDLEDPNLILNTLDSLPLQGYIDEQEIDELILDHYEEGMMETFPRVKRIVVISRIPIQTSGFTPVQLFPLDYEEFLAFETGGTSTTGFNYFLKSGTLPAMARQGKHATLQMKQFFQQQFTPNEQALILILARYNTQPMTIHQIYTFTKEHFKISKDFVYRAVKQFIDEGLLYFIDNVDKRSGKKMILYDFAFAKYLTVHQPFGSQFDSMVALTLLKHSVPFRTLGLHGYLSLNDELIIPAPFESEEIIWLKSHKKFTLFKKYGIRKVTIITVASSYAYTIENLNFEAIPFYEWTIMHQEEREEPSLEVSSV